MIGDICSEIGRNAVVPNHHPVLVVAEFRRLEPQGSVPLFHVAFFQQILAGLIDFVGLMQCLFAEPYVKTHIETFQVFLQGRKFFLIGNGLELFQPFILLHFQEPVAVFIDNSLGCINDIMAVVPVLRELTGLSKQLQIPGVDGTGQVVHLVAGVIDIIFLFYVIACRFQQVRQGASYRGTPAVAYMQRARRIGAYIFNLYFFIRSFRQVTVIFPGLHNMGQHIVHPVRIQIEIQETGSGDLHPLNISTVQMIYNILCQHPGVTP